MTKLSNYTSELRLSKAEVKPKDSTTRSIIQFSFESGTRVEIHNMGHQRSAPYKSELENGDNSKL